MNIDGRKQVVGPGSVIYFRVNENENMTNVGQTPATYHVIQWFTPLTLRKELRRTRVSGAPNRYFSASVFFSHAIISAL